MLATAGNELPPDLVAKMPQIGSTEKIHSLYGIMVRFRALISQKLL